MAFETIYNGQPADSFTDYVTPIQPPDVSGKPIPYSVPGFNSTEYGITPHDSYHSNIAPDLANLVSELFTVGGAACGGIGGWKCAHTAVAAKEVSVAAAEVESKESKLLPAVRFVRTQLTESFGWLPLWQRPTCKTIFQLGEKYAPKAASVLRGGLVGGITGAVAGYITGYAAGAAVDWCVDRIADTYSVFSNMAGARKNID